MQILARSLGLATLLVSVVLWSDSAWTQATNPVAGTWKLNVAKSKYNPGPTPQSLTVKFEAAGDAIKTKADGVRGDGQPIHIEYTVKYDGKDYPITGSPIAETVSMKRIDANTAERTDKRGGKVVATLMRRVSSDGKTMTVNYKGTDAQGKPFDNMVVLEKQ
jgi:hypothetical protein